MAQAGVSVQEYIESIPAPVVTVTQKGTINSANKRGLALLGKTPEQIQGEKGGDVFECENAILPGGCGKTIHCSACTIRNTVMDTVETGRSHAKVPAYLRQRTDDGAQRMRLLISTEKKGGIVFLEVDEIRESGVDGVLPKWRSSAIRGWRRRSSAVIRTNYGRGRPTPGPHGTETI